MKQIVEITGVMGLLEAMERLLDSNHFDALIHSMAVSDYIVRGITTESDLFCEIEAAIAHISEKEKISSSIEQAIKQALYTASGKISSDLETLTVFMDKAPKVISIVKKKQPEILLVGFKLLAGASEEELIDAAERQMQNSGSDFVLANDLDSISGDEHRGLLIDINGVIDRPRTKHEIAQSIARVILGRLCGGE